MDPKRPESPYANPYLAGFGLGLVLLSSFVVMGWGLGASSAFASCAAWCVSLVSPAHAHSNPFFAEYLDPSSLWMVLEVSGLFVGGMVSGLLANRSRLDVEKGPRIGVAGRFSLAFLGGGVMAVGARMAGGCTSGQALTGGALLNAGSWAFMMCVFGGAYALAWFLRREWI